MNVQVLKDKADDYGEAFSVLTEASVLAMREELDAWEGEDECPLRVRHEGCNGGAQGLQEGQAQVGF